jgi:hypothetical protein
MMGRMKMKNSFLKGSVGKILSPGIVLYDNVYTLSKEDIETVVKTHDHINENPEMYPLNKVKNTFFYGLDKIGRRGMAENIQKGIMYYFAKYCDIYEEVIHNIQWQENIYIDIELAGEKDFVYNPNASHEDQDGLVKNTPFSRQVAVEILIDDNYSGGQVEWPYLNNLKIDNWFRGSILFYPANYLFSKTHNTIMKGRKVTLTTFFNGGKDFLAEENGIEEDSNLVFSYLR